MNRQTAEPKPTKRGSNPASLGNLTGGSRKGVPNKANAQIKDMIIKALDEAGGVSYLKEQAMSNPGPFMGLVGKVLPLQITGEDGGAIKLEWAERALAARTKDEADA